jgi:uncharacterized protein
MSVRRPLLVNVADLLRRPGNRRSVQLSAVIPDLSVAGTVVPEGAEVTLDVVLEALNEGIVVRGVVGVPWRTECRRCLAPIEGQLSVEVMEVFEDDPVEGETSKLEADKIDLEPLARETVLLELPQSPLCREDCAGLCAECGADRNVEDCGHALEAVDDRWAGLQGITFED